MPSNIERRVKILEHVLDRQKVEKKTTKAEVIRYMKKEKLASGETTHNIIKDLINEGKLNMEEIHSQVHFLTVNETNEFNLIDATLTAFEGGIDYYLTSMDKLYKKGFKFPKYHSISLDDSLLDDPHADVRRDANETVQFFIVTIGKKIRSEEDAQILYRRINKILQKGPPGFWDPQRIKEVERLQFLTQMVENLNKKIQSGRFEVRLEEKEKQPNKAKSKPKRNG